MHGVHSFARTFDESSARVFAVSATEVARHCVRAAYRS